MNWVEISSITIATNKSEYRVGDNCTATVNITTGDGTTASGRVMLTGLLTQIQSLTLEPHKNYTVTFNFQIPDVSAGTYNLTAEVDEWVEGPTPI